MGPEAPACLEKQFQRLGDTTPLPGIGGNDSEGKTRCQAGLFLQVTEAGVEELEREPVPPANTEVCKEPAERVTPTQGLRGPAGIRGSKDRTS